MCTVKRIKAERSGYKSAAIFAKNLAKCLITPDAMRYCSMEGKAKGPRASMGLLPAIHETIKEAIYRKDNT